VNQIPLRALRPSHPLAYLAAIGLHRIVESRVDPTARLSWTHATIANAVLHTTLNKEQVLCAVEAEWNVQTEQGTPCLIRQSGQDISLPPKAHVLIDRKYKRDSNGDIKRSKRGEPQLLDGLADPAKLLPEEFAFLAEAAGNREAEQWLWALGTDAKIDKETRLPTISRSRFYLLSRQQTLAQQFDSAFAASERAGITRWRLLEEAVDAWRRYELAGGMNWDIGANQNAAENPFGDASMALVPGAVWLAMNALPLFPVSARRGKACTRGWQEVDDSFIFVMPVWRPPLLAAAIEVLLDHPVFDVSQWLRGKDTQKVLNALGVAAIYTARVLERRVASQTERYLEAGPGLGALR
jgi:hypothetical protein